MAHFDFAPLVAIFGTSVTVIRKGTPSNVNGYLQPSTTPTIINAALVPAAVETYGQLQEGFTLLGDAWLIAKEGDIHVNDEVVDGTSNHWKVLQIVTYPEQGNVSIYSLKRLT